MKRDWREEELGDLEGTLAQFRDLVRQSAVPPAPQMRASVTVRRPLRWAAAVAAAALVVAVPVYREHVRGEARVAAAAADAADALLLKQVDTEISRAVPEPMEPLVKLAAWEPDSGGGKNSEGNQ